MSEPTSLSRAAHASASLAAAGLAIFIASAFTAGVQAQFAAKFGALAAHAQNVKMLTARLEESRTKTREALVAIGANPEDLVALSSPGSAKALVADACAALSQTSVASCVFEEAPLSSTMSSHRALMTATGPISEVIAGVNAAASPPLSVSMLTIRPGAERNLVAISAVIEIAGARSPESAS